VESVYSQKKGCKKGFSSTQPRRKTFLQDSHARTELPINTSKSTNNHQKTTGAPTQIQDQPTLYAASWPRPKKGTSPNRTTHGAGKKNGRWSSENPPKMSSPQNGGLETPNKEKKKTKKDYNAGSLSPVNKPHIRRRFRESEGLQQSRIGPQK